MSEYLRLVETKRNVFPVVSVFSELDLGFGLNVDQLNENNNGIRLKLVSHSPCWKREKK